MLIKIQKYIGLDVIDYFQRYAVAMRLQFLVTALLLSLLPASYSLAADEISYNIEVNGLEDTAFENIYSIFEAASVLKNRKSAPFISVANLRSNLNSDIMTIEKILRSEGYYNGTIAKQFIRNDNHYDITLNVTPGPLYFYGEIKINFEGALLDDDIRAIINDALNISVGDSARAEPVISAQANISNSLPKYGYPFASNIESEFIVDHKRQTLAVIFSLDPGTRRFMGSVQFEGLKAVNESFLRKYITWPQDSYYEQRHIDELRSRIIKSNLFSSISIDIVPNEDDRADIIVRLTEAKHRTIGTSIGYSTAEGIGGEVSWAHRNFLGDGCTSSNDLRLI